MHSEIQQLSLSNFDNEKASQILETCVHCGFCLATCPTYQLLGDELDSPRGRIYLIKSALEDNNFTEQSLNHLDRCLTCRSCETTCPSGIKYSELLDIGRNFMEKKRPKWQSIYRFLVRKFLSTPLIFKTLGIFVRHSGISSEAIKPEQIDSQVLLLAGCAQPMLAPNINHSIKNILARLGVEVIEDSPGECCGALDQHLAAPAAALKKVKRNIDSWYLQLNSGVEVIISSASGCGVMVKDYPELFEPEDPYYEKAKYISQHTQDIAEYLATQDLTKFKLSELNVSYHEPCTLQHGQNLSGLVESILERLGYEKEAIKDSHLCCGSAGTYSIFQPKLSKQLKVNKITSLTVRNPKIIVTSNIGCLMHLQQGSSIPVKHWVELLDG